MVDNLGFGKVQANGNWNAGIEGEDLGINSNDEEDSTYIAASKITNATEKVVHARQRNLHPSKIVAILNNYHAKSKEGMSKKEFVKRAQVNHNRSKFQPQKLRN